ncbi:MAG: NADH-quinone oxidoreductase subunit L [Planctomycetota bacterium]|jgi:NADH-quinone oxidoreductase subunit L
MATFFNDTAASAEAFSPNWMLLLLVPLIPFVGYIIQISFRKKLPWGDKLLTGGMFVVLCITVYEAMRLVLFAYGHGGDHGPGSLVHESANDGKVFHWLYSASTGVPVLHNVVAGLIYDPLAAAMLAVVGIVSFCVHLFSQGYMHGDKRYNIFFANLSLFTFAMLGLILSDNILFLFIFWEIMGVMSYLLIGHFSHDSSQTFFQKWATWASKKAFLTTRVGDTCLFVGMFMFYKGFSDFYAVNEAFNSLDQFKGGAFNPFRFTHMWAAGQAVVDANGGEFPLWMTVAGLFAFGGTIGKSAQFPLHIWLPDAMAGPTPVSAMIHAATMVAAGVFLLGRMYPLLSPDVLSVVTVVGATTALFAATIGCVVYDMKAVLAFSTISQLGFMVAAVGLGGVVAGMFHMVTHAFFKACLFLSAGSVIHGCNHMQDMRVMGGVRKYMPITFACTLICTLAIAGVPLFSGFYSKDMIILAGFARFWDQPFFDGWSLYALISLAIAAALTAFYMFRLIFMTFYGEYRGNQESHAYSASLAQTGYEGPPPHAHDDHGAGHDDHGHEEHGSGLPHESPRTMVIALCVLAFFGLFVGHFWFLDPTHVYSFLGHTEPWFTKMVSIDSLYGVEYEQGKLVSEAVSSRISLGITDHTSHVAHTAHLWAVGLSLSVAGFGIFMAWFLYIVRKDLPAKIVAQLGMGYDFLRRRYLVDEAVNATVIQPTMGGARVLKAFDEKVIDGFVLLVGRIFSALALFWAWVDKTFVDGIVNGVGLVSQAFGSGLRLLQTGRIQQYVAFAVGGSLLAAAWLILS